MKRKSGKKKKLFPYTGCIEIHDAPRGLMNHSATGLSFSLSRYLSGTRALDNSSRAVPCESFQASTPILLFLLIPPFLVPIYSFNVNPTVPRVCTPLSCIYSVRFNEQFVRSHGAERMWRLALVLWLYSRVSMSNAVFSLTPSRTRIPSLSLFLSRSLILIRKQMKPARMNSIHIQCNTKLYILYVDSSDSTIVTLALEIFVPAWKTAML